MYVLGIETSCDETSAAVVKNGHEILSNQVSSSLQLHKKYGGVIPEIASRMQLETIVEVSEGALKSAGLKLGDIGLISVTSGPGLLGSLLVGISFAKGVSLSYNIALLGINHLFAHIYAGFMEGQVRLPFVGLVVSGGHTSLFYVEDFDKITPLGATLDDACGEAFDKVAKILGLGYPGGPLIENYAKKGDPKKIKFSCANAKSALDFSFSGIKTAVMYYVKGHLAKSKRQAGKKSGDGLRTLDYGVTCDIAASFQEAVIDTLVAKSLAACRVKGAKGLVIGGGVAANGRLREKFDTAACKNGITVCFPRKELCLDNAAMVAGLGYVMFRKGFRSNLDLDIAGG